MPVFHPLNNPPNTRNAKHVYRRFKIEKGWDECTACESLFEMLERKAFYLMLAEFMGIKRGK
jgi:hypothetical protein